MELSRRAFAVLCGVVEVYVRTAAPVASRQVAGSSRLGLSSATIRNVMARLEEEGYLSRSHTSAGCVPTDLGFRRYVDSLVQHRPLAAGLRRRLSAVLEERQRELMEDIEWVAEVTAEVTREAGMAIRPMDEGPVLEAVSFVDLGGGRVLGVVVTSDGTVDKKVLNREVEQSPDELLRQSNRLSQQFRGRTIEQIRLDISDDMQRSLTSPSEDPEQQRMRTVAEELFAEVDGEVEFQVAGTDYLLNTADFADADRIRSLFAVLQDRRRIVREWRRALGRKRTQVIIGNESDVTASGDLAMVATLFFKHGRRAGAVGVVGPRRMDYGRVVPVVEFIGDSLTQMLEQGGILHG